MHALQEVEHDGTVELGLLNAQQSDDADDFEEFESTDELSKKIDVVIVLERTDVFQAERCRADFLEHPLLIHHVLLQLVLDGLLL